MGALFGKYATEKVFASGGIEAPDNVYLTVQPLVAKRIKAHIANNTLFISYSSIFNSLILR
jgi:hypothetical protein